MSDVRKLAAVFALAFVPSLAAGCASAPPPVPLYAPKFTYSYPPGEAPASDVTIAIVKPNDANAPAPLLEGQRLVAPSAQRARVEAEFRSGIVAQLQELLGKKGFKQTGPFDDLDSMTFPDKKGSDLTLTTQLGLALRIPHAYPVLEQGFGDKLMGGGVHVLQSAGLCAMTGYISFVMLEPLSGEKIWIKKVDLPPTEADCSGKGTADNFNAIDNGVARLFERTYQLAMKKAWDYLSPEEVMLLKKQSQELRAKKVY
ncbi:MAG: hypothetical protein JXQ75_01050 [Phycisphaerae bacterium]|nr:hypothetical protein [Phycisphaerae bacterium]